MHKSLIKVPKMTQATLAPCFFISCLIAFATPIGARAGEPAWKVGLAQVKITPEQPVLLSGYGGRTKPFEKVAADLYVKAMVLDDGAGQRGVIVTSARF